MYKKKCDECGSFSYSAAKRAIRKCVKCEADIADNKAFPAGKEEKECLNTGLQKK